MTEKEQKASDQQLSGRETFREPTSPSTPSREPVSPKIRDETSDNHVEEPFAIEDDNNCLSDEKKVRKFFMTVLKPTQKPEETPVAYAGWKPAEE